MADAAVPTDDSGLVRGALEKDSATIDSEIFRAVCRAGASAPGRRSGIASDEVRGTPTLFMDGVVHHGGYDAATLVEALGR
jgi:hypothetical protein